MISALVKNRLSAVFCSAVSKARGGSVKKATPLKKISFFILYLFVGIIFFGYSTAISILFASALLPSAPWLYYLLFMGISLTLIFILGIFEAKAELFECKDNDLLLSMPIRPRDIVLARTIIVLIYNYVIESIIMIPAIVVYAIFAKSIVGIIGGIIVFLIIPIFATALATGCGYLVAEITRKLKFQKLLTVVITFILVGLYFVAIELFSSNIEELFAALSGLGDRIGNDYKFLKFIGSAALLKPLSLLFVVGISLLFGAVAYFLISYSYIRIVTSQTGTKRAVYKEKKLRSTGSTLALAVKDIRHFFSSPMYVLNGALGLIIGIALGVFMIIKGDMIDVLSRELQISGDAVAAIAFAILNLATSTVIISACALSVEGKDLWILRSMPIDARRVIISKALMQFIISAPPILVSSVFILIATMPSPYLWPIFIIAPQIASLFYSLTGILINLAFPKFTYENETQAVKQSLSSLLNMLVGMLVSAALLVGVFFLALKGVVFGTLLLVGAPIALIAVEIVLLIKPATKRYNSLNL